MAENILITGGAGFIGSHLADELLEHGYHVRVLDNLSEQVHGVPETAANGSGPNGSGGNGFHPGREHPTPYLDPDVELIEGDVRNPEAVHRALDGIDAVFHLAALVGVGQSMYEIDRYISVNDGGTAVLLQAIIDREEPLERLVVASSMSLYGEGAYRDCAENIVAGRSRGLDQLRQGSWELMDGAGEPLQPVPTPESAMPNLTSVYALSKYNQEQMCLIVGRSYDIPTVGLRFFNTYGPRQALSNPYTGVMAIFAARLLNDRPPLIYEDGCQLRDFVSVYDVATACRLALESPDAAGEAINVGSGEPHTIAEIAQRMAHALDRPQLQAEVTNEYRVGDIRHCYPDMTKARDLLGFQPEVSLELGMIDLADWLSGQTAVDNVDAAQSELQVRGLRR